MRLTDAQLLAFRTDGYVVVPGFLDERELQAARDDVLDYLPSGEEYRARPERFPSFRTNPYELRYFPFSGDALNGVAVHADLVDAVERVLGTDDVRLGQVALWGKYGGSEFDQQLHSDHDGNSLLVPRRDGSHRQLQAIVYLTDVTPADGPTFVVSQRVTDRHPELIHEDWLDRERWADVYREERAVTAPAGTLLLYCMRTFHRGSAIRSETTARFTLHAGFGPGGAGWLATEAWGRHGKSPAMKRFLARATPRQRELVGFPAPGHPYWDDQTLAEVAVQHPGIDLAPYRAALSG